MTTVYLLRHGAYENPKKIYPFRLPGYHLSSEGKSTVKKLVKDFQGKNIDAVYSSPLERTRETAKIIAHALALPIQMDERLLETRSPVQGKPLGFDELMGGWNIFISKWYKERDGETLKEIFLRMENFINEKINMHKGKKIIVVSHGDPIMVYNAHYQGKRVDPQDLAKFPYIHMGQYFMLKFPA